MKKTHIPYIVFSLIIIVLFVFNVFLPIKKDSISDEKADNSKQNIESKNNENDKKYKKYTVKADGEQILLYDNKLNVIRKLNIDFNNLRDYDKKMFIAGIYFDNIEDVYLLIEDFSS